MLSYLGVKVITTPDDIEAEELASYLVKKGIVSCVLSGDSDVLMFGGNLLRLTNEKNKSRKYKLYNYQEILNATGLPSELFVYMCAMLGTDFNNKHPNIGPVTVMSKMFIVEPIQEIRDILGFLSKNLDDVKYLLDITDLDLIDNNFRSIKKEEIYKFLHKKNIFTPTMKRMLNDWAAITKFVSTSFDDYESYGILLQSEHSNFIKHKYKG